MTKPGQTVYLKDYKPFPFELDSVALRFELNPTQTIVHSAIRFVPKSGHKSDMQCNELQLDGENLELRRASIDGVQVTPTMTPDGLRCKVPEGPFLWEAEVAINPSANTALEGLYMSGGMYCTQCEAEGFRKITYYPDRPDVMSVFTVRIEGQAPVLLSNGNPQGAGPDWAEWHDPWPKPAYLFALVAGDLECKTDHFTTSEGREVALGLYVRPEDLHKCDFALEALKASMRWDEQRYGRAYDLNVFNIVAVSDFNMGAMENKGLNIFNSAAVLASPETSTDDNFERIEAIIAHEYFHNWTGNRITCRDWFQLCLKEGLTVFRDAEFTADMRSAGVKRIRDVMVLRAHQFPEDEGPLAHPVRPESFQEINNFYTATVYEKGAELIFMLQKLVGKAAYRKALDTYFERHDGQACTIEDWLKVFEDVTGRDLSQFKRWYSQAGTPELHVTQSYENDNFTLHFEQKTRPTPASPKPQPLHIPVALSLFNASGEELVKDQIIEITQEKQSVSFPNLPQAPIPSLLRDFSAPVILHHQSNNAFLMHHDTNPFTRWEAGRKLAEETLIALCNGASGPQQIWLDGIAKILDDPELEPAYQALMLKLPTETELAATLARRDEYADPDALWAARNTLQNALSERLSPNLDALYDAQKIDAPFKPNAEQAGKRSLALAILNLITRRDGASTAQNLFASADNMTLKLAALGNLIEHNAAESALAAFKENWSHDALVMDKWFSIQIAHTAPDRAVPLARTLSEDPAFEWKNPNRFRALIGALCGHHAGFHRKDGSGYDFVADWLIRLDPVNPQITARLCAAFQSWRRYDPGRQENMKAALSRIAGQASLSGDTQEMVARMLTD